MSVPPWRRAFIKSLAFPPDPFQLEAFDALDTNYSVLVSAPTGSGKTLVALYAIERALELGNKAFYTTPLKALSNQKRAELAARYGEERVGLLTGDTSLRPEAPVVVMTTEVLRNMLLTGSDLLERLSLVVLDEVHFLQDLYRGGVWEEVIVLAPPTVSLVCLSATVANAAELGEWLHSVRGPTQVVLSQDRPVSLAHHFALRRRGEDLPELEPLLQGGRLSQPATEVDTSVRRAQGDYGALRHGGAGRGGSTARAGGRRGSGWPGALPPLPFRTPRRSDLIEVLDQASLLPAIVFIFSRAACDDAVRQCVQAGLRLTTAAERSTLRRMAENHVDGITDEELDVLGYGEWLSGLEGGFAAHHAGLVPAFREAVEEAFAAGLLRVVYATETLSLGINMPARTVVLERFTKWGQAGRTSLGSGDYLQLTGRAGRRGLDRQGHAVVVWSPEITLAQMAEVATGSPPALRSSFRPNYNLAANLVQRFDRPEALELLRRSFAQWQADRRHPAQQAERPQHRQQAERPQHRQQAERPKHRQAEHLAELLGRRLAVLQELGFVRDWHLTLAGHRLSRIYHEADIVVAQLLSGELADIEPSVLAGVLSALVFEPRRPGRLREQKRRLSSPSSRPQRRRGRRPVDRLGDRRRLDLDHRLAGLAEVSERVRAIEEIHRVPPVRRPEPALAPAVVTWARGANLGEVLAVAAASGIELAPGDFVRITKQLADLMGQVAMVADPGVAGSAGETRDPGLHGTAAAARAALPLLLRGVVAASILPGGRPSTTPSPGSP